MSDLHYVDMKSYVHIENTKLPHWEQAHCVQFVTFRLADSLPRIVLDQYRHMRADWLAAHPTPWDDATHLAYDRDIAGSIDHWLAASHGRCLLQYPEIRTYVEQTLHHRHGTDYHLHAYVIMPNHVHVLFTPDHRQMAQHIVGEWKKWSARRINAHLRQRGPVWQKECFDRLVRSPEDFRSKLQYILHNPDHFPSSAFTLRLFDM